MTDRPFVNVPAARSSAPHPAWCLRHRAALRRVDAQVTVSGPVPDAGEQVQPFGAMLVRFSPAGSVSVICTVPTKGRLPRLVVLIRQS